MLIGGIVVNWALNLWLIPTEGAVGAAIATAFTQGAVFIGELILAIMMFKLRYTGGYILKVIVFIVVAAVIVWFIGEKLSFLWIFEFLLSGIILMLVSFLFGFLRLFWTD